MFPRRRAAPRQSLAEHSDRFRIPPLPFVPYGICKSSIVSLATRCSNGDAHVHVHVHCIRVENLRYLKARNCI